MGNVLRKAKRDQKQAGRKERAGAGQGHDLAAITDPALDAKAASDLMTAGPMPDDVTVIFVLGGPGSGKGTQCAKVVAAYGHTHLSAGDLLRDEVASGSALGKECEETMKEGKLVPMEVIIGLLRTAMLKHLPTSRAFLIDGFPRALDQAARFEAMVKAPRLVLAFDCPEEVMEQRLLARGQTSGRSDDNAATIRKRFATFQEQSLPVIHHYTQQGKCAVIAATAHPDEVFASVRAALQPAVSAAFTVGGGAAGKQPAVQQQQQQQVNGGTPALAFA